MGVLASKVCPPEHRQRDICGPSWWFMNPGHPEHLPQTFQAATPQASYLVTGGAYKGLHLSRTLEWDVKLQAWERSFPWWEIPLATSGLKNWERGEQRSSRCMTQVSYRLNNRRVPRHRYLPKIPTFQSLRMSSGILWLLCLVWSLDTHRTLLESHRSNARMSMHTESPAHCLQSL